MLPNQLLFSTPSNLNGQILTQKTLQEQHNIEGGCCTKGRDYHVVINCSLITYWLNPGWDMREHDLLQQLLDSNH